MPASPATTTKLTASDPRLTSWRAFLRAYHQVARRLDEDLRAEHDLSLQEYAALLQLAEAPERRLRMGRLADGVLLSRSGVTRLVDRLVDDGLVDRLACPSDARGAEAILTEAGLKRLRSAAPTHLRGIQAYFLAAFQSDELKLLERTMDDVACGPATHGRRASGHEVTS
jgi:DNA-binding MarR family transcriptional regulator